MSRLRRDIERLDRALAANHAARNPGAAWTESKLRRLDAKGAGLPGETTALRAAKRARGQAAKARVVDEWIASLPPTEAEYAGKFLQHLARLGTYDNFDAAKWCSPDALALESAHEGRLRDAVTDLYALAYGVTPEISSGTARNPRGPGDIDPSDIKSSWLAEGWGRVGTASESGDGPLYAQRGKRWFLLSESDAAFIRKQQARWGQAARP